jgi:hypothetical protein
VIVGAFGTIGAGVGAGVGAGASWVGVCDVITLYIQELRLRFDSLEQKIWLFLYPSSFLGLNIGVQVQLYMYLRCCYLVLRNVGISWIL